MGGYPWSLQAFDRRARAIAARLRTIAALAPRAAGGGPIPVAWVSAEAHPDYPARPRYGSKDAWVAGGACPPGDWRFLHVIDAYNRIGEAAMAAHELAYIDTWPISLALRELA